MNNVNTSKDKSRLIYYIYNNSPINYYTTGRFLHRRLPDFPLATVHSFQLSFLDLATLPIPPSANTAIMAASLSIIFFFWVAEGGGGVEPVSSTEKMARCDLSLYYTYFFRNKNAEPVFVNLLRSPRIDYQTGGPV